MGLLRASDFLYTLRFLRLLTTPWDKTEAFKRGIIDKDGNRLRDPQGQFDKKVYNSFHKLVFNLKRLLGNIPLGKTRIASYAAALYLVKEHTKIDDDRLVKVIKESIGVDVSELPLLEESDWFLNEDATMIEASTYTLTRDMPLRNGELLAKKNTRVIVEAHEPIDHVFGIPMFKGYHVNTKNTIYITQEDITH